MDAKFDNHNDQEAVKLDGKDDVQVIVFTHTLLIRIPPASCFRPELASPDKCIGSRLCLILIHIHDTTKVKRYHSL